MASLFGSWEWSLVMGSEKAAELHLPERAFEKLSRQLHVLLEIRQQMSHSRLPVVRRIDDAAGEEVELF